MRDESQGRSRNPKAGFVSLKIYNVVGEEIATLVSQELNVGTFRTQWDASQVPSGVYFYRLKAGEFVQMRKLVVMK